MYTFQQEIVSFAYALPDEKKRIESNWKSTFRGKICNGPETIIFMHVSNATSIKYLSVIIYFIAAICNDSNIMI